MAEGRRRGWQGAVRAAVLVLAIGAAGRPAGGAAGSAVTAAVPAVTDSFAPAVADGVVPAPPVSSAPSVSSAPARDDGDTGGAAASGPGWPLRYATRFLTANFMEPREGRFHAGIDLKTDGRPGVPVLAVEDGWVRELRALPEGYGRAVLLRGDSGRDYVYAHLERFADRLRPPVAAAQAASGRYRAVVALPRDSLRVRRGEVLALSGQSGTVGPHLHFEVRGESDLALNPLRTGFAVPDTFPPRIVRIRALPAGPGGRVEGGATAWSVAVGAGSPAELPPLRVRGPVALAVEIRETIDVRGHLVAAHGLSVRLDGREVFAVRNDTLPLGLTHARRCEWLETGRVRAQWLHRWGGPALPGREGGAWAADGPGLPPGRHQVELAVTDLGGGRAVARWALLVEPAGESEAATGSGAAKAGTEGEARAAGAAWRSDPVGVPLPPPGGGAARLVTPFLELVPAGPDAWRALAAGRPAGEDEPPGWRRLALAAGEGAGLLAPAVLYVRPDTVAAAEAARLRDGRGLAALGPAALFAAASWPAAGRAPAPWPAAASPAQAAALAAAALDTAAGVYQQTGPDAWSYRGRLAAAAEAGPGAAPGSAPGAAPDTAPDTARDTAPDGGWLVALPGPGRFAVLRDERPPWIGAGPAGGLVARRAAARRAGVTLPRWETVAVALADAGSGVDPDRLRAALDGRPLTVEPDLIRGRLLVELPDTVGAGPHVLEIEVRDRAGHAARRRIALVCRAAG